MCAGICGHTYIYYFLQLFTPPRFHFSTQVHAANIANTKVLLDSLVLISKLFYSLNYQVSYVLFFCACVLFTYHPLVLYPLALMKTLLLHAHYFPFIDPIVTRSSPLGPPGILWGPYGGVDDWLPHSPCLSRESCPCKRCAFLSFAIPFLPPCCFSALSRRRKLSGWGGLAYLERIDMDICA